MKLFCCKFFIFKLNFLFLFLSQGLRDCPGVLQQDPESRMPGILWLGQNQTQRTTSAALAPPSCMTFQQMRSLLPSVYFQYIFYKKENVLGGANRIYQIPLYCRVSQTLDSAHNYISFLIVFLQNNDLLIFNGTT